MKELRFTRSTVEKFVFYRGKTVYNLYTEDSILTGTDQDKIDQIIEDLNRVKIVLIVEGDLQDFLGVKIERKGDGNINLTQPNLID